MRKPHRELFVAFHADDALRSNNQVGRMSAFRSKCEECLTLQKERTNTRRLALGIGAIWPTWFLCGHTKSAFASRSAPARAGFWEWCSKEAYSWLRSGL